MSFGLAGLVNTRPNNPLASKDLRVFVSSNKKAYVTTHLPRVLSAKEVQKLATYCIPWPPEDSIALQGLLNAEPT